MNDIMTPMIRAAAAAIALAASASPALAQDRWDWGGGRAGDKRIATAKESAR